jgi:biotin-dependent carboxylase-like uncharacterized protein
MTAALRALSPGLMTTLQDLGRPGFQRLGIPVSGALDPISLRAANMIVGNPVATAALEIAYQGPMLAVEADSVRVALVGGGAALDILDESGAAERVPPLQSVRLQRGQRLRIGALAGGAVAYLAVEGGFAVEPMLGSRSTYVRAGIGGFGGRAIVAGDALPLSSDDAAEREERMLPSLDLSAPARFRVVLGPQDDYFTDAAIRTLLEATYTVTQATDRMGMRLDGPLLEHAKGFNIVSDGIAPGAIQVPGNGLPIVLLADRQTTGGYPKVAAVISADLAALGRLMPGAKVAFEAVSIDSAEAARRQTDACGRLRRLRRTRRNPASTPACGLPRWRVHAACRCWPDYRWHAGQSVPPGSR